jgi:magnesium transporter
MADFRLYSTVLGRINASDLTLTQALEAVQDQGLAWLDIAEANAEVKAFLAEIVAVDELVVEDIFGEATTASLRFEDHRFFAVRARNNEVRLDTEFVHAIVKGDLLITVRHHTIPAFTTFGRRFLKSDAEDLALGIDYLLYEWLDAIADDWTPILGRFSGTLDDLEYQVFDPSKKYDNLLESLHGLKGDLREANKSIESLNTITMRSLQPGERLVGTNVKRYFTDLHQLTTAMVKRVSNYSAGAASTRDSYLSNMSMQLSESNAKLTEVMTTLTMVGAIMLPLTLIAGIFGMNNDDLPQEMFGGFWGIMGFMGLFAVVMMAYFWRKGWLSPPRL